MSVSGTFLIDGEDYGTDVEAVNLIANGQQIYVVYIDASGNLKCRQTSTTNNVDGSVPIIMSGCSVS
jgi:hypothetical protein